MPTRATRTTRHSQPPRSHARRRDHGRRRNTRGPTRRNRRRGAPRALVVRRLIAALLATFAAVLVLRPGEAAERPQAEELAAEQPEPGIPLVLPLADPAGATVLAAGQWVDLYVAQGDEPPALLLSRVRLVDLHIPRAAAGGITGHPNGQVYIVVRITELHSGLVESLLAASAVIATLSATDSG